MYFPFPASFLTHIVLKLLAGRARGLGTACSQSHTQRSRDTFASDCERLAAKYARRAEGPLAQSEYGDLLRTPSTLQRMTTPLATPSRGSGAGPGTPGSSSSAAGAHGVMALFSRVERLFQSHTVHCPFVRGTPDGAAASTDDEARPYWTEALRQLECCIAGVEGLAGSNVATVLEEHLQAGCIGVGVLRDRNRMEETVRHYAAQLHLAVDDEDQCRVAVEVAVAGVGTESGTSPNAAEQQNADAPIPGVQATDNFAVKSTGPVSAIQQLEVEDVLDVEAQYRLDVYRAWTSEDREAVPFVISDAPL